MTIDEMPPTGGKASTGRDNAKNDSDKPNLGRTFSPKQAVVVIHGMGEQRPLETLRDFVRTVYEVDPQFSEDGSENELSIVPDTVSGSAELRRITTHSKKGRRTDFFEFYWADIMNGTPLELVTSWISALLLRSPFRVPPRLRIWLVWLTLWGIALALIALALMVFYPNVFGDFGPVSEAKQWLHDWRYHIAGTLAATGLLLILWRLLTVRPLGHAKLLLPGAMIGIALVLVLLPEELTFDTRVWATLLWAFFGWLFSTLVGPYLGDVVRYVRATPQTVGKRQEVRERGLRLLRTLHEQKGPNGEPYYSRIVIVGHSLGSIVAYDLLQLYWEEAGPTHRWRDPAASEQWMPSPATARALTEANRHVVAQAAGGPFDPNAFALAQRALFEALRDDAPQWRISDLITLGSPLAHSDFLVADSRQQLNESFRERRYSTTPPRPDPVDRGHSMTYFEGRRGPFTHFAAVFAAVRWTNIYDECWFPLLGDIVSGPCRPVFGLGIEEHRVYINRPNWLPGLSRLFTHTHYWQWDKKYDPAAPPKHIALLRNALELERM